MAHYIVRTGTTLSTESEGSWDLPGMVEEYDLDSIEEETVNRMSPGETVTFIRSDCGQSGTAIVMVFRPREGD